VDQPTQLKTPDIEDNSLKTVPDVVSSLTSLKQLNMSRFGISSLPERFVCHMFITTSQHNYYTFLYIVALYLNFSGLAWDSCIIQ